MERQDRINSLAKHFENFNTRIKNDLLFQTIIHQLIDGGKDVYEIIDMLIHSNNELVGIVDEFHQKD